MHILYMQILHHLYRDLSVVYFDMEQMPHGYPGTTAHLLQGENFCIRKSQTDEWKSEVSKEK